MSRRYALKKPCPKCPFRTDVPPYLRPERAQEIAHSILGGADFPCHQTTLESEPDDEGYTDLYDDPGTSIVCAGSIIVMEKQGTPNQMLRIAERIGSYDRTTMDMDAPVYASFVEWQRSYESEEDEDREPCHVVGPGCEAPAGYAIGGGIVEGTEYAERTCYVCGEWTCDTCGRAANVDGNDEFVCDYCIEDVE